MGDRISGVWEAAYDWGVKTDEKPKIDAPPREIYYNPPLSPSDDRQTLLSELGEDTYFHLHVRRTSLDKVKEYYKEELEFIMNPHAKVELVRELNRTIDEVAENRAIKKYREATLRLKAHLVELIDEYLEQGGNLILGTAFKKKLEDLREFYIDEINSKADGE